MLFIVVNKLFKKFIERKIIRVEATELSNLKFKNALSQYHIRIFYKQACGLIDFSYR